MDWGAFESLSINYEEGYKEGISLTDKSLHKSISKFLDEGKSSAECLYIIDYEKKFQDIILETSKYKIRISFTQPVKTMSLKNVNHKYYNIMLNMSIFNLEEDKPKNDDILYKILSSGKISIHSVDSSRNDKIYQHYLSPEMANLSTLFKKYFMISNMNGLDIFFKDNNEELLAGITIHLPSIFMDKPDIKLEVYDKNLM